MNVENARPCEVYNLLGHTLTKIVLRGRNLRCLEDENIWIYWHLINLLNLWNKTKKSMTYDRFYHRYPAHILRGHSIGAARTFARTLHGLDQICTDFARIHTDVHGRTDAARTLHGHFMVPLAGVGLHAGEPRTLHPSSSSSQNTPILPSLRVVR